MNEKTPDPRPGSGETPRAGRSRVLLYSAVTLLLAAVAALVFLRGPAPREAETPLKEGVTPFEHKKWVEADPDDGLREEMLDDLQQRHLKTGMTRQEVLKLLGEPGPRDRHPCLKPLSREPADTLCYTVSVGMDPCTFLLGFDARGRLFDSVKDCS